LLGVISLYNKCCLVSSSNKYNVLIGRFWSMSRKIVLECFMTVRPEAVFQGKKVYMFSCSFFMWSWIMFFFSFSFSMLLWKTNLTFLSIYKYDFKIVLLCYFDSGRVIFLEKFNRSSFIVVLNLYWTNIIQIQSNLYIKATQWKLKMWPL